jgi:curli biogenesis system outer membrane secretion channel CsgG
MKKMQIVVLSVLFGLACGCGANPTKVVFENPQQIKSTKTIAVFPFACNRSQTGQIIADALVANLEKSRFTVIEQDRLQQLLKEQGLTLKQVSEDHRAAVGKLKGIDAIVTGSASVRVFGGYTEHVAESTARMIDVATGEILLEVNFASENARGLKGITPANQIGAELAKKFSSY